MIVRENPPLAKAMLQEALDRLGARERVAGIHVSDLIYCLRKSWYRINGVQPPYDPSSEIESIFALGHGHHAVLQPPENSEVSFILLTPDGQGIHGTVDVFWPESPIWDRPTEIKSTRYSANKDTVYGTPHYLEQLASYVLGLGYLEGQLVVWHMMGDYKEHRQPILKAYDVKFEERELTAWQQELYNRAIIVKAKDEPDIMGDNHYTWECKYCAFSAKRGGPCPTGPGRIAPFFVASNSPWEKERGRDNGPDG